MKFYSLVIAVGVGVTLYSAPLAAGPTHAAANSAVQSAIQSAIQSARDDAWRRARAQDAWNREAHKLGVRKCRTVQSRRCRGMSRR